MALVRCQTSTWGMPVVTEVVKTMAFNMPVLLARVNRKSFLW